MLQKVPLKNERTVAASNGPAPKTNPINSIDSTKPIKVAPAPLLGQQNPPTNTDVLDAFNSIVRGVHPLRFTLVVTGARAAVAPLCSACDRVLDDLSSFNFCGLELRKKDSFELVKFEIRPFCKTRECDRFAAVRDQFQAEDGADLVLDFPWWQANQILRASQAGVLG